MTTYVQHKKELIGKELLQAMNQIDIALSHIIDIKKNNDWSNYNRLLHSKKEIKKVLNSEFDRLAIQRQNSKQ